MAGRAGRPGRNRRRALRHRDREDRDRDRGAASRPHRRDPRSGRRDRSGWRGFGDLGRRGGGVRAGDKACANVCSCARCGDDSGRSAGGRRARHSHAARPPHRAAAWAGPRACHRLRPAWAHQARRCTGRSGRRARRLRAACHQRPSPQGDAGRAGGRAQADAGQADNPAFLRHGRGRRDAASGDAVRAQRRRCARSAQPEPYRHGRRRSRAPRAARLQRGLGRGRDRHARRQRCRACGRQPARPRRAGAGPAKAISIPSRLLAPR